MTTETERCVPEHPGWQPWWVHVAEYDGRKVMLIDREQFSETIEQKWSDDMRVPAAVSARFDPWLRYWVRRGPVPCLHLIACPFPGKDHAEELYATDSLPEAEAAYERACERLREGG